MHVFFIFRVYLEIQRQFETKQASFYCVTSVYIYTREYSRYTLCNVVALGEILCYIYGWRVHQAFYNQTILAV